MIKLSTEAKELFNNEIKTMLARNEVEEASDYLRKLTHMGGSKGEAAREVLAGLCEMGYAFVGYLTTPIRGLATTKITKAVIPDGVEEIGNASFANCRELTTVKLPDTVYHIHDEAFAGCRELKDIKLPSSLAVIGEYAFSFCLGLTHIELPEGFSRIGVFAFDDCESLKQVTLPSTLERIGAGAFDGCSRDIEFILQYEGQLDDIEINKVDRKWIEEHSKVR